MSTSEIGFGSMKSKLCQMKEENVFSATEVSNFKNVSFSMFPLISLKPQMFLLMKKISIFPLSFVSFSYVKSNNLTDLVLWIH
mgnify:CR=1 FL=1